MICDFTSFSTVRWADVNRVLAIYLNLGDVLFRFSCSREKF